MADIKAIMQGKVYRNGDKYQWPANKLSEKEMAILHRWRQETGTPINHLLQQAVTELDKIIVTLKEEVMRHEQEGEVDR